MRRLPSAAVLGLMLFSLCCTAEAAVKPVRVQGKITAIHGNTVGISTYNGERVQMTIGLKTHFVSVIRSSLSAIKAGEFVGVGATGPRRQLKAVEVVIFPSSMRGTGEGHYPWSLPARVADADMHRNVATANNGAPQVHGTMTNGTVVKASQGTVAPPVSGTMTNGTVTAKTSASGGRKLTIKYKGGEVKILIPRAAPVVRLAAARRAIVIAGAKTFAIGSPTGTKGRLKARLIAVGKNGVMPPM